MRILVLPSWYPPDGGEFFRQQSHSVSRQGHVVKVIVCNATSIRTPLKWLKSAVSLFVGKFTDDQDGAIEVVRMNYPSVPFFHVISQYLFVCAVERCFNALLERSFKPDLVHVHSLIWAGIAARRLRQKYNLKYFVTEHRSRFVANQFVDKGQLATITDKRVAMAAEDASKIFAVSGAMLPALKALVRSSDVEFGVMPNMVDTKFFSPDKERNRETAKFRFFSVAGLVPLKGFVELIDAFALLREEIPNVELVIGGDGRDRPRIEQRIKILGLEENVYLLGRLDRVQVRDQMRRANAFALATRYEAFGVVFIEAMACGVPVVTTQSGGPESIITDEVGYLSEVGDIQTFAVNMKRVITEYGRFDPVALHSMAKHKYSEDVIASELIRHFRELSNAG